MRSTIVIKVGTSTLLSRDELPSDTFGLVASSITELTATHDVLLVSSGAIGFGVRELGLEKRLPDLPTLQALASIGQVGLMRQWGKAFGTQPVGQVLVTTRELEEPSSALMLAETFREMWRLGVVPVINENDAITNEEIAFGDNDVLAARVAVGVGASTLVLLTDQDGVQADFGTNHQRRLPTLDLTEADRHVVDTKSEHGTGGIASKLLAGSLARQHGIDCFIAYARQPDAVRQALAGESGTRLV